MRIAQIAPLMEAVPPKLYGGTERIVAYLTDELVAMGHEVSLFASGGSTTLATLEAAYPQALRLDPTIRDHIAPLLAMLETVAQRAREFDVIHLHCDYLGYPVLSRAGTPFLATLHGRLDFPELKLVYQAFADVPVVSISNSQRGPLPEARYVATVYHGLPERLLLPGDGAGGYLAFLGRISPEKAPDRAIRIAARAGMKLRIAAKIDRVDREYFTAEIEPLLAHHFGDTILQPDADAKIKKGKKAHRTRESHPYSKSLRAEIAQGDGYHQQIAALGQNTGGECASK